MSRQTPRKRHARNTSASRTPRTAAATMASDYESDAALHYPTSGPANALTRTNTELNLSVIQRYIPSVTRIIHLAVHTVVYAFSQATAQWEKTGVEGTMFVCAQDPGRACIFILNRKALENVTVDLERVTEVEVGEEITNLRLAGDGGGEPKVLGLWVNKDSEATKGRTGEVLAKLWAEYGGEQQEQSQQEQDEGVAAQAVGRRLSLTDLFGRAV